MLKIKYTLTNKIFANVAASERLYGQIEALRLPEKLQLNLKKNNLVKSSYVSNKIEGNPLSHAEVTNLLLDDRVPVNRDEKEVTNYFEMLESLDKFYKKEISLDLILDIHKKLFDGLHEKSGVLRNELVAVGRHVGDDKSKSFKIKHLPPFHHQDEIKKALNDLLDWIKKQIDLPAIIKTGAFHHHFVYIHPFEDGNGRVCRILTALLFIKAGYRINRYFILDDYYDIDRFSYSDSLHTADSGDKTKWLEYYSDGVKYSLQSALSKAKQAVKTLKMDQRPTPKEKEVLEIMQKIPEITSTEIAKKMKVSRQQAHNLLSSLVKKDLIKRKGSTKSSYYVLE